MSSKKIDRVQIGPLISSGVRSVVRDRGVEGEYEVGGLRQVEDGKPIVKGGELVDIGEPDGNGWRNVTVLYRSGPAQVATPAYREGYDRIFGKKTAVGSA